MVVYLVDAFAFGSSDDDSSVTATKNSQSSLGQHDRLKKLTTQALFRCFLEILRDLPDMAKMHVQMQIVPLQTILDFGHENTRIYDDTGTLIY